MSSISEDVDDDMFSKLPEHILSHILSLMSPKFAVQTSVLSKRWRYSWMFVTNVDFDDTRGHHINENNFTKFVDQFLKSCKTSQLQLFRLHLFITRVERSSVSRWIDKAIQLNVRELDICGNNIQLPFNVFTCKTLTKLTIARESFHYKRWKRLSFVNLPCLKTLDIASDGSSIVNVFKLVHGCPMLESLTLDVATHDNVEEYIFNIPTLKRLKLIYGSCDDNVINKVVLRVPSLEYLLVGGVFCSFFVFEDVSSLVGASITCWERPFNHPRVDLLINQIRGVQNLSLKIVSLTYQFTTALPLFSNMKHLELKGVWEARVIPQFLTSCPKLKSLCIDAVGSKYSKVHDQQPCWIEPKQVPACMLTNLTTINYSNCDGRKCEVEFLDYMLGNAKVLKTATITYKRSLGIEDEKRLFGLRRASKSCKIHFRPWKLSPSALSGI